MTTHKALVEFFSENSKENSKNNPGETFHKYTNLDGHKFLYFCDHYNEFVENEFKHPLTQMFCWNNIHSIHKITIKNLYDLVTKMYELKPEIDIKINGNYGITVFNSQLVGVINITKIHISKNISDKMTKMLTKFTEKNNLAFVEAKNKKWYECLVPQKKNFYDCCNDSHGYYKIYKKYTFFG